MKTSGLGDRFLGFHSWVLLGYALLGRGFSYFGVAPLYIGEISLLFGFVTVLLNRLTPYWMQSVLPRVLNLLPAQLLVVFMGWGLCRTIPYFSIYGIDAIRDAAIWYYGFFALIIAIITVARPERLIFILKQYKAFVGIFLAACPIFFLIHSANIAPQFPGSPVRIIDLKAADLMIHLSGVTAFFIGLKIQNVLTFIGLFMVNLVVVVAQANRSGTLAFLCSFSIVTVLRPDSSRIWRILATLLLGGVVALAFFPDLLDPVLNKMVTIFIDDGAERYQGTKEFRMRWWGYIYNYTFGGDYFWTGKGFGVNLGLDDHFDPLGDGKVRSPHNGHLCILARMGVPGFLMWIALQGSWVWGLIKRFLKAYQTKGRAIWTGVFLFLFADWVAFMVTINFEVILEGPTGGIWLWSVFGIGLSAMAVYDVRSDLLMSSPQAPQEEPLLQEAFIQSTIDP